jgi:hypothetical protein
MPTHDQRLLQRLQTLLDQRDDEFIPIRFAARDGYTLDPPRLMGGSSEQRLAVLEAWFTEWSAATDEARQATSSTQEAHVAITSAIEELAKLRELEKSAS